MVPADPALVPSTLQRLTTAVHNRESFPQECTGDSSGGIGKAGNSCREAGERKQIAIKAMPWLRSSPGLASVGLSDAVQTLA